MNYKIIETGSKGNALLLDNILVDCGVSYKKIKEYDIKLILLTHIHGDHFKKSTIRKMAEDHPSVRFGCCKWLVEELIKCGVDIKNIDVYEIGNKYRYNERLTVEPILLYHNVDQCGYRMKINNKKVIYCTDTNKLDGITAKNYDYYFIEANYEEEDIDKKIKAKKELGLYCYEEDAKLNHLSKEKCDKFLLDNMGEKSIVEYMHKHID